MSAAIGDEIYGWASDLFPLNRSLTGEGVRETLRYLKTITPNLTIESIDSGEKVFDWVVPEEWDIRAGYIENENGDRIIDFADNNLHMVGYSRPVDEWFDLQELNEHLHSIPEIPDAIPYITTYYRDNWGFCLPHNLREKLPQGRYRAVIDSTLKKGVLNYGEILIPGKSEKEVLFSSYICHPSLANDQISGPVMLTALARWLSQEPREHSYRLVFIPENIGSLVYLHRHLDQLKKNVIAGLVVACVGDDRAYGMMETRLGDSLADRALIHVLKHHVGDFQHWDYLWPNRGSDERNYCMPGIDLPVASFFRSKYAQYPEYHTSHDNLDVISPKGFSGAFEALTKFVQLLEHNRTYRITTLGEPRLGPRNLYPKTFSHRAGFEQELSNLMNLLAYCDGAHDLLAIADRLSVPFWDFLPIVSRLKEEKLIH